MQPRCGNRSRFDIIFPVRLCLVLSWLSLSPTRPCRVGGEEFWGNKPSFNTFTDTRPCRAPSESHIIAIQEILRSRLPLLVKSLWQDPSGSIPCSLCIWVCLMRYRLCFGYHAITFMDIALCETIFHVTKEPVVL